MTVADVQKRVEAIRLVRGDAERAHGEEDDLWESVLIAIARREAQIPAALAREALKTRDLNFPRWTA